MKRDRVESAEDLIRVVTRFTGPDSETLRWVKAQLRDGVDPKEISGALRREAPNEGVIPEENNHGQG